MRHTRSRGGAVLFPAALCGSALSVLLLWRSGFLPEQFADWRTGALFLELFLLLALFLLADRVLPEGSVKYGGFLLIGSGFLWVHRAFLPLLVSLLWMLALLLLGELLLILGRRRGAPVSLDLTHVSQNFLTGAALWICLVCFFSLFGFGGPGFIRRMALSVALLSGLGLFLFRRAGLLPLAAVELPVERASKGRERTVWLLVFTLLLLHAGRMNITLDYDSLHYGLRSFYVLDNGHGIYENLGAVNAVYFYPKGMELLVLPLSGTASYGFVLGFSFWCGVFLLLLIRSAAGRCFGREAGTAAMLFTACIPGVMNLTSSAKADILTLLVQFMFVDLFLRGVSPEAGRGERRGVAAVLPRWSAFFWGLCMLMLTLTLKPTALVFSGGLVIAALLFQLFTPAARFQLPLTVAVGEEEETESAGAAAARRGAVRALRKRLRSELALPLLLSALALLGVTYRSFLLSGYPLVTVFTGLWEQLGMRGHYPLLTQTLPNAASGLCGHAALRHLLERIFALCLAPVTEEDVHILIAWGTVLFPLLLLAALLRPQRSGAEGIGAAEAAGSAELSMAAEPGERRAETALRALCFLLGVLLLLDCISLLMLYQVDGNYYNLSYVLAVCAAAGAWREEEQTLCRALSPALLAAVFFMGITNWAGARGLTEPKLNHYGFYDHRSDVRDCMIREGNEPIYRYLKNNPRLRVMVMEWEPECYLLPCSVQSYTDLEGSGGNVRLVKTLNAFRDYLEYADISLLCAEESFLSAHSRAEEMLRYMQEDGSITTLICQEGHTLYEYHPGIRD